MIKINPPRSNDKIHLDQAWYRLIEAITTTVEPNSVATLAALAALDDVPDGNGRVVRSLKAIWMRNASSVAAPDGITIVASADGGNWIRMQQIDPAWGAQATWYINPTTGDDEHTGATSGEALATISEFSRRMNGFSAQQDTTVWVEESLNDDDVLNLQVNGGHPIRISGVPSLELEATVATWTKDVSETPPNNNDPGTISLTGWTPATHIARILRMVNGPAAGMDTWIAADLGGSLARVGSFTNGAWATADPVVGNTARVFSLPTIRIGSVLVEGETHYAIGSVLLTDLDVKTAAVATLAWTVFHGYIISERCKYEFLVVDPSCVLAYFVNCAGCVEGRAETVWVAGVYSGIAIYNSSGSTGVVGVLFQDGFPSLGFTFGLYLSASAFWSYAQIAFFSASESAVQLDNEASAGFRYRIIGNVADYGVKMYPGSTMFLSPTPSQVSTMLTGIADIWIYGAAYFPTWEQTPYLKPHMGIRILSTNESIDTAVQGGVSGEYVVGIKGALTAGVTRYALPDLTASTTNVMQRAINQRSTLGQMRCTLDTEPGNGEAVTIKLLLNGANLTAYGTVTISNLDKSGSCFVPFSLLDIGDKVSVEVVTSDNAGFGAENLMVTVLLP